MRASLVLFVAFGLVGCGKSEPPKAPQTDQQRAEEQYKAWAAQQPRPSSELVDRIEARLIREPCIGSLRDWSPRFYGYSRLPWKTVDTDIVNFHFEEAGASDRQPGRHITEPDSWVRIDDSPIKMVWGDYDVGENRIRIAFCGKNVGGGVGIDRMDTYYKELERRRSAHAK